MGKHHFTHIQSRVLGKGEIGNAAGEPLMQGRFAGGRTLTADAGKSSDRDGLSRATYSHQWLCVDAYGNETVPGKWHLDPDMCIPTRSLPNS